MHMRLAALVVPLLGTLLSGCSTSDDRVASLLSDPGLYVNYSCPQIVAAIRATIVRQRELEQLMAKAGDSAGGRMVSSMAYRPEYLASRGEQRSLQRTAAEKQCDLSKANVQPESPPPKAPATARGKKGKAGSAPAPR